MNIKHILSCKKILRLHRAVFPGSVRKAFLLVVTGLLVTGTMTSCNDFLDIQPIGKVIPETGKEYRALLTSAYNEVGNARALTTFRSDEITLDKASTSSEDYNAFFDIWAWNDLDPQETTTTFPWRTMYHVLYIANYIVEHQNGITEATTAEIRQMVGECYMLRAYMHFLLVNLYGEPYTACNPDITKAVPLKLDSDVDKVLTKNTVGEVYRQILDDIRMAQDYLNVEQWEAGYTYRFNTLSAVALKARVELYMGNWQEALDAAAEVVERHGALVDFNQTSMLLPDHYQSVEAIVSLEQTMPAAYKTAGRPSNELIAAYKSGDQRKSKYYKQVTASVSELTKGGSNEYSCTFRSGEFYLTAAEAALQLSMSYGAEAAEGEDGSALQEAAAEMQDSCLVYLTALMKMRYHSAMYPVYETQVMEMEAPALLQEIYDERRRELAFEGHRWFDLRRTTRPALTKTYDGQTYTLEENDSRYTLRLPAEAIAANPGLAAE